MVVFVTMATEPLAMTTEAIALTEKKMDMTLGLSTKFSGVLGISMVLLLTRVLIDWNSSFFFFPK